MAMARVGASSIDDGYTGPAAAPRGRARLMRSRWRGECIASQRSLRRCTLSQKSGLLPNTRARMRAVGAVTAPAVIAQFVHVLTLHTDGFGQRTLGQTHGLHEF